LVVHGGSELNNGAIGSQEVGSLFDENNLLGGILLRPEICRKGGRVLIVGRFDR
jgi:hypothetical protein